MKLFDWLLCGTLALSALPGAASPAAAGADFPVRGKTLRVVVGLPAGGPSDAQARVVALELQKELGLNVVVENKPGASMMLASVDVARSMPDGYTLLYTPSSAMTQVPHTLANVQFDPFKDFSPVSLGGYGPLVLFVHKSVPARNVKELVAHAKANPGKLNYASFGTGTSSHLYGQMFGKQAGIDIVHIPYKGSNQVTQDFVSGQVQLQFATAPAALGMVKAGLGTIIAVAAPKRSELLPGLPTMTEQGITGVDIESWIGFFGPAKMPPEVVDKLNAAIVKVLAKPTVKEEFAKGAWEASGSSAKDFASMLRVSYDQWGKVVEQVGYRRE